MLHTYFISNFTVNFAAYHTSHAHASANKGRIFNQKFKVQAAPILLPM